MGLCSPLACFLFCFFFHLLSHPLWVYVVCLFHKYHIVFSPSPSPTVTFITLHSPHPSLWSLPLCHPGLFVPIFSPSPWFTCSPPASLTRCFIGEKLYLVEAGKGWSFCVLEVSLVSRHTGILMAIGWLDIAFCEHVHLSFFLFSSPWACLSLCLMHTYTQTTYSVSQSVSQCGLQFCSSFQ